YNFYVCYTYSKKGMINMLLNLLGFVLLLMTSVVLGILVWNTRINQPSQVTVRIKDNNYDSKK
ncbi:hypothetical protein, partial [Ligilactobacillus salivarius]